MEITNRTKKEFLLMYSEALKAEREAEEEYEQLRIGGLLLKSPSLDGNGGAGGAVDLGSHFARMEQIMQTDLRPKQKWRMDIRRAIVKSIGELPTEREQLIMRTKYLHLIQTDYERRHNLEGTKIMTWEQVAKYCDYSKQGATKIHGIALCHLAIPKWVLNKAFTQKSRRK